MATFTAYSNTYDGRYLQLTITQTKNTSSNSSTLNWTLTSAGGSVNYYTVHPTTIKINGIEVYSKAKTSYTTAEFPAAKGSTSGSLTVYHNSSGNLTVPVVFQTAVYSTSYMDDYGGSFKLDSIATKATLTGVGDIIDGSESVTILPNYSNPSGAYIELILSTSGADDVVIPLNRNASYQIITLTSEQITALRKGVKSGDRADLIYRLDTHTDLFIYSHEVVKSYILTNHTPTLNPVAYDGNDTTYALTGNRDVFIRGFSNAYVDTGAQARKDATITKYYIRNNPTLITTDSGTINKVQSNEFVFTVEDSRGNRTTQTLEKTLIEYIPVTANLSTITQIVGERGAISTLNISGNYFGGSFGNVNNSLTISYCLKNENGELGEWIELTPEVSGDSYNASQEFDELDYQASRTIVVKVKDKLVDIEKETVIQVVPVFDWSDQDFNFNVPVAIQGWQVDTIVEESTSETGFYEDANGTTQDGGYEWTFRKWSSGLMECWCSLPITTNVSTAWGGLYTSGRLIETNLLFPREFADVPVVTATLAAGYAGGLLMTTGNNSKPVTNYSAGTLEIARGTSLSNASYTINYNVKGRWK
jgi:hypothetical protein